MSLYMQLPFTSLPTVLGLLFSTHTVFSSETRLLHSAPWIRLSKFFSFKSIILWWKKLNLEMIVAYIYRSICLLGQSSIFRNTSKDRWKMTSKWLWEYRMVSCFFLYSYCIHLLVSDIVVPLSARICGWSPLSICSSTWRVRLVLFPILVARKGSCC